MRHPRCAFSTVLALTLLTFLLPAAGQAQSRHQYTVGLMGGLGGTTDAEPDPGLDNFGFQVFFSLETDIKRRVSVRAGQIDLAVDSALSSQFDAELQYLTVSGEYQFTDGYYESALFLGLGAYDVSGNFGVQGDTSLGITAGTSGDFRLTERLSFLVEFAAHFADLDYAQFFFTGQAGLAFHF